MSAIQITTEEKNVPEKFRNAFSEALSSQELCLEFVKSEEIINFVIPFLNRHASRGITALKNRCNRFGVEDARALAGNTTLTSLDVDNNEIGAEGAIALAGNTTLTSLNVDNNEIGAEGAIALAGNTTLTSLDVGNNRIGDEGVRALAANTTLTSLDIRNNKIGGISYIDFETLKSVSHRRRIQYLTLKKTFLILCHREEKSSISIISKGDGGGHLKNKIFEFLRPLPFKLNTW